MTSSLKWDAWQFVTALTTASGTALVTLVVSYVLNVLSALAVLDDALALMQFAVKEEQQPSLVALHGARASVQGDLSSLNSAFIQPAGEAPPAPDLSRSRQSGIRTVSDEEFARAVANLRDRRCKLLGLMRSDAWC